MEAKGVVVVGGGPAGLAAGYYLSRDKLPVVVIEKDGILGGLSRTVLHKGFRFDIGPHRFFTKSPEVTSLWEELMGGEFLTIPRLTRIYYRGRLFYYPLKPMNALFGLGPYDSVRILVSLLWVKLFPTAPEQSFEDWVSNRFGRVLYRIFFKTYTEKVWGMPCTQISADWAAQRIRNLSLWKALMQAFGLVGKGKVASLVEEFKYPRLGAGQLYTRLGKRITSQGGSIRLNTEAVRVTRDGFRVVAVEAEQGGERETLALDALITSMPLTELVLKMDPPAPDDVLQAARSLGYRSIVTVNFILKKKKFLDDNWIYIHSPEVSAGRMQIYNNWGPGMVPDKDMCSVGLEYFCTEGDTTWRAADPEMLKLGREDLARLGFASGEEIVDGLVLRYAKAYPVYDDSYQEKLAAIRGFLGGFKNLITVGRYGQFRYNNMDHSIMTANLAVRRLMGEDVDPWSVNADAEYHEEGKKAG